MNVDGISVCIRYKTIEAASRIINTIHKNTIEIYRMIDIQWALPKMDFYEVTKRE